MKNALAWVAVLCLVGSAAVAEPFVTTKDNSILGYDDGTYSERYQNCGASWRNRIAKRTQHQMILDFDTAAVEAWMTANPLGAGQYYQAELFLNIRDGWQTAPSVINIRTLNVDDDWAEGDGNWGWWTMGTPASIYGYAQAHMANPGGTGTIVDPATSIPWKNESGNPATNFTVLPYNYQNAVDFTASSADHGTYVGVVLDDDTDPLNTNLLVNDLLNNPENRGLRTWKDDYVSERVHFREQAGGNYAPYIEVTVVPEPAGLSLLALGCLALIRRRRSARRARAYS